MAAEDEARLRDLDAKVGDARDTFLGYPSNTLFDYSPLFNFLAYPLNNIGDPYIATNIQYNTHEFEREVVSTFAHLAGAPEDSVWGYVTNGGTEGNMYGLFLARELLPDAVAYFSADTHYSVSKIIRCLKIPSAVVKSSPDGRMDLHDLSEQVSARPDAPAIVLANVGTTMKGATDDVDGIHRVLDEQGIRERYIHVDAALSGMILPFVDEPQPWDFRARVESISVSGHKMIGSPIPCGVVLAKKQNVDRIARGVEYVSSLDTTLPGSRNGITPLFLWYAFRTMTEARFRARVARSFAVADYAISRLRALERHAWRHRNSVTVVFDRPPDRLVSKWQLAVEDDIAHVVVMPQVTRERIDLLIADLEKEPRPLRARRLLGR